MRQERKKTFRILLFLGLLVLAAFGATIAYYNSQNGFVNEFHVSKPGVAVYEKFDPSDYWVPGEEKQKEVKFVNTGEQDMVLRFAVNAYWDATPSVAAGQEPVEAEGIITLYWNQGTEEKWPGVPIDFTKVTDSAGDTYYYYNYILKAGTETKNVLESVRFSADLSNDDHLYPDYAGLQVNLTIKGETVLANEEAVTEQWTDAPSVSIDRELGTVTWTIREE